MKKNEIKATDLKKVTKKGSLVFKTLLKKFPMHDNNGNVICYPEIIETTNYELLKLLSCNRIVAPAHVQKMGASITQLGYVLRQIVVVKIGYEYYIVDGQHLYTYLKSANLTIRCQLIEVENEQEALKIVTKLNSTSRNWGIKNFVEGWANFNEDIALIKRLKKNHNLTYTTIAALLANTTSTAAKLLIASGDFEVVNQEQAVAKIMSIDTFYIGTSFIRNQYATTGLIDFMGGIGMENYTIHENRFIESVVKQMEKKKIKGKTFGRREDNLEFFNECWKKM